MPSDGAIDDEEFILLYLRANYPVLIFPHEFLTLSPRPVIFGLVLQSRESTCHGQLWQRL